jgi:hypothetical protein
LQVLAVGANALGPEGRWWTEEDDPFQLLAACQARIFIDIPYVPNKFGVPSV